MITLIRKTLRKIIKTYYTRKAKKTVKSFKAPLIVNNKSWFNTNTELGENTNFNGFVVNGKGRLIIGDNFHSGPDCRVILDSHNYQGEALPYDRSYITKDVIIGDNVWLGHGVLILGGVTIGDGAIIQAGSVVVNDIPKYGIAGGSPAKVFKYRDKSHYERLLSVGAIHKKSFYNNK
ncbi:acyltransferase [Bacillus sp. m3-13]|uniref:acyltransferase n=1 Tax=Bacillus sp. m3-13 TaxID=406124 RepID=UPI0001E89E04|nr:acyltransferase [Bacillus sp. m3-13]